MQYLFFSVNRIWNKEFERHCFKFRAIPAIIIAIAMDSAPFAFGSLNLLIDDTVSNPRGSEQHSLLSWMQRQIGDKHLIVSNEHPILFLSSIIGQLSFDLLTCIGNNETLRFYFPAICGTILWTRLEKIVWKCICSQRRTIIATVCLLSKSDCLVNFTVISPLIYYFTYQT